MSLYQVGNLDFFVEVTRHGFEIKSRKWNEKTNKWVYTSLTYYSQIQALWPALMRFVLDQKAKTRKDANLNDLERDYDEAVALIERLRSKYNTPLEAVLLKARA